MTFSMTTSRTFRTNSKYVPQGKLLKSQPMEDAKRKDDEMEKFSVKWRLNRLQLIL